jgi:hypothetical protein
VVRPWVKMPIACGGTGLAGIGQLADIAIGQGLAVGAELVVPAAASRLRPAQVPAGLCPPGRLLLVPNRRGGELGAGGDVELGEHVREMGLHGAA